MEQANRRLGLLASHLSGVQDDGLALNPTSAATATESATVALPEKLCDDPDWRVNRYVASNTMSFHNSLSCCGPDTMIN